MCLCSLVCACEQRCPWRPKASDFLPLGVRDGYEPPDVGVGNGVLCESSMSFQLPNHHSRLINKCNNDKRKKERKERTRKKGGEGRRREGVEWRVQLGNSEFQASLGYVLRPKAGEGEG